MPKIIENVREKLLEEARCQVMEQGYSNMTIRSVARACGVGVGTVYNYFPSKDMLVASFMLEDWFCCVKAFSQDCDSAASLITEDTPQEMKQSIIKVALHSVYEELTLFQEKYKKLFTDKTAGASYASASNVRHVQLREQIATPLSPLCAYQTKSDPKFLANFMAESMMAWTMTGCDYEPIAGVLLQLL